jgi:hypothetical protein
MEVIARAHVGLRLLWGMLVRIVFVGFGSWCEKKERLNMLHFEGHFIRYSKNKEASEAVLQYYFRP